MKKSIFFLAHAVLLAGCLVAFNSSVWAQKASYRQVRIATVNTGGGYNSTFNGEENERKVYSLINRERQKQGLSYLEWNGDLARLARDYSQQMAEEDFFSHYDNRGASVVERARGMRIKGWRKIGENLFESIGDRNYVSSSVIRWMKSPAHRLNILDPQWTQTGIGIARSRDGKIYITQVFVEN